MTERPSSAAVSTKLRRIAMLAKEASELSFTGLAHHIDRSFLLEAYRRTRKDGAVGVDGVTAEDYAANLEENLESLLNRFKSGTYRAPPVRRVHIPKGDGKKTRPLGIPSFEDKILQRAVTMVLEAVYEQDFLPCSYGFRPGRSAHQALEALWKGLMDCGGGWVLDVDIQGYFDNLEHVKLREILDQRVRDGVMRRAIGKWLKAGVLEGGELRYPEAGSPQGGVISPLLANVYLHTVLDTWYEQEVRPLLRGRSFLIRYADDFVIVFTDEHDAKRVQEVLPKRFARYGLSLHPEKTRLVYFGRPDPESTGKGQSREGRGPETFDLLGFTHHWGRSRRGNWVVKRRTARSRLQRAARTLNLWCAKNRHRPLAVQHEELRSKLVGHYAYYGLRMNYRSLARYYRLAGRIWKRWLSRRSQRGTLSWRRFDLVLQRYPLPPPRINARSAT